VIKFDKTISVTDNTVGVSKSPSESNAHVKAMLTHSPSQMAVSTNGFKTNIHFNHCLKRHKNASLQNSEATIPDQCEQR
jgi:hypothetical protein